MERLTDRSNDQNDRRLSCMNRCYNAGDCINCDSLENAVCRLAAYEDAEEAGLLVRLPCKPREVVWVYYPKYKEIERIAYMTKSEILEDIEIFRAVICKTREEAEAALKES